MYLCVYCSYYYSRQNRSRRNGSRRIEGIDKKGVDELGVDEMETHPVDELGIGRALPTSGSRDDGIANSSYPVSCKLVEPSQILRAGEG